MRVAPLVLVIKAYKEKSLYFSVSQQLIFSALLFFKFLAPYARHCYFLYWNKQMRIFGKLQIRLGISLSSKLTRLWVWSPVSPRPQKKLQINSHMCDPPISLDRQSCHLRILGPRNRMGHFISWPVLLFWGVAIIFSPFVIHVSLL